MRQARERQRRLDGGSVSQVVLNFNCRDELIPILRGLQQIYATPQLRDAILNLVERDVSAKSRSDRGREGLSYWCILVLAAVRLGCHLNYDKLHDLAENHRALRSIMEIGEFDETEFSWKRIRDNVCLLQPATIDEISQLIVGAGHQLVPAAVRTMRADSFVIETNIHYPTDSSLIVDGIRKIIELSEPLATSRGLVGWRQHAQLLKTVKSVARRIARIAAKKGPNYQERLRPEYVKLLNKSGRVLQRANELLATLKTDTIVLPGDKNVSKMLDFTTLETFIARTQQVREVAHRRVIQGEKVPNNEKLFSLFEPHTQLYKRGKAGEPVQFGRLVLVFEDGAGFLTQHRLLKRTESDRDVAVPETRRLQQRFDQQVEELSFDRGFHSPENHVELAKLVKSPCLPKPGFKQAAAQLAEHSTAASLTFRAAKQRHPGIESAINGLQSGNGQTRCRDRGELGLERYLALGILGRNLHTFGRLLIQREALHSEAARTQRAA
jgi:IS5 family transposase